MEHSGKSQQFDAIRDYIGDSGNTSYAAPAADLGCSKAAVAMGETVDFGWGVRAKWIRAWWQGRVDDVTTEFSNWLESQPPAPQDAAAEDPREIVGVPVGYLINIANAGLSS